MYFACENVTAQDCGYFLGIPISILGVCNCSTQEIEHFFPRWACQNRTLYNLTSNFLCAPWRNNRCCLRLYIAVSHPAYANNVSILIVSAAFECTFAGYSTEFDYYVEIGQPNNVGPIKLQSIPWNCPNYDLYSADGLPSNISIHKV